MLKPTLEAKIRYRIKRGKASAYVPSDFSDLSKRDQVGRVLRKMVRNRELIKAGQGIYVRTQESIIDGGIIPEKDLRTVVEEAFSKLKIKILPTKAEKDYSEGKTTQIPTGRMIGVNKRVSRTIGYNGRFMKYEQVTR